jgi:23S rRNA A1618 N6-methylase RlmF
MPYYKPLNLIYIHIPKTGGMSIEEYFYKKCNLTRGEKNIYGWYLNREKRIRFPNDRSLQHLTYQEIIHYQQYFDYKHDEINNTTILVSVRNPFERIISDLFWGNKIKNVDELDEELLYDIIYNYLYVDNDIDNHRVPQYKYILDENKQLLKNIKIVKTETLQQDMIQLGYNDFDIFINKNKRNEKETIHYMNLLNQKSMDLIYEYYKKDFEIFGYSYENHKNELLVSSTPEQFTTTIVSAFIANLNKNNGRSIDNYIDYGKLLINIPNPKVIFIDNDSYNFFFKEDDLKGIYNTTTFIKINKDSLYLYNYLDKLTNFNINTENREKNTIDYLFVQNNKTEWVREAIQMNIYNTEQYIWIDFGIYHMIKNETEFKEGILSMTSKKYDKLRIASCKYRDYTVNYNVYEIITWTFAGSVFGGHKDALLKFADLAKNEVLKTIEEKKSIMWEINIWYLVKLKHIELFDFYSCGHDIRILKEY